MDIRSYLSDVNLSQHENVLIDNEIHNVDDLRGKIKINHLTDIGIPLGHANRILKRVNRWKSADIKIITSDECVYSLSKSAAISTSGYFRALLDTACTEVESGEINLQIRSEDFNPIHDMMTYPTKHLKSIMEDLSPHQLDKLRYNVKYFQLQEWIPVVCGEGSCEGGCYERHCESDTQLIEECSNCKKLHTCCRGCTGCAQLVCIECSSHSDFFNIRCDDCITRVPIEGLAIPAAGLSTTFRLDCNLQAI